MPLRTGKTLLTQQEAAKRLGVNQSTVSRLLHANTLEPASRSNGRNVYVTAESVIRYSQQRHAKGRPLSPESAMGLLLILSRKNAEWLDKQQRHRVHVCLKTASPGEIAWKTRSRATTVRLRTFPSNMRRIRECSMDGGVTDETVGRRFGLPQKAGMLECYTAETTLRKLMADRMVREADSSNVTMHVISDRMFDLLREHGGIPVAVCAVDLMESSEPREYATGAEQLEYLLDEWRERA